VTPPRQDGVRCDFEGCATSMIFRVVLAVVDQLGAAADVDLVTLESLDVPLDECISALATHHVEAASVSLTGDRLVIDFWLSSMDEPLDPGFLGDGGELVESFFEVESSQDPPTVRLTAPVG
jgi:hypothetical protein